MKMPRLNNDERNQAIGMQNADIQQLLYRGTLVVLERLSSVFGDDSVSQLTTAADDCYIVLQYLHNRRLTAPATGR